MFRIRRIRDCTLPSERDAVAQVQQILREQFGGVPEEDIAHLPEQLHDPLRFRYRTMIFTATDGRNRVRGFAILLHMPDLRFCYLDFLSAARLTMGHGIGGALYERLREEALVLGTVGLFFESLPADPALCRKESERAENRARLMFYERHGARPIAGTAYETPLRPGADCPPHLLFDDLGRGVALRRDQARAIVRAILERKYGPHCPPGYIDEVVESFRDDPIRLHEPLKRGGGTTVPVQPVPSVEKRIALVVNDRHEIHHVRERGYVEAPVRVEAILRELDKTGLFERIEPRHFADEHVRAVHDGEFVDFVKRVCAVVDPDESVYPYVFPIRNRTRPPWDLPTRAGYYCIDTFTPLHRNAWPAARRAVDCALTGADRLLEGVRVAYALVRPPGHHAERRSFGGFCYLNSTAVAAHYLSRHGKVAVLDLDYHHGNGTQDVFYDRDDVLTVSIHGHPRFAYPYFTGFIDERGAGRGAGYNVNLALREQVNGTQYGSALDGALRLVARFAPRFLVVALGFDTAKGDPTGSWDLRAADFAANGRRLGRLGLPLLVVQEGGYLTRALGSCARAFFKGLAESSADVAGAPKAAPAGSPAPAGARAAAAAPARSRPSTNPPRTPGGNGEARKTSPAGGPTAR
ncbi:MAG: histone deacetylase family protein [Deltaproteobacteria bacterium]|nr:histone deacetylase family protein [Deltaproteobacteria bacterium]